MTRQVASTTRTMANWAQIRSFLRDEARAICLGEGGRHPVKTHFAIERFLRSFTELYCALLHLPPPPSA